MPKSCSYWSNQCHSNIFCTGIAYYECLKLVLSSYTWFLICYTFEMLGSELFVLLRTITLPIQTLTCGREDQLSNTQVRASQTPCLTKQKYSMEECSIN